ncbi:hypothetical protein C9397_06915 [Xanthomonas vasicola pv. vasculorum]|uniref:Uncharacterized protein n=3 Tax=Xanthomonas vasicola TaxID=56459 RepID=A0A836ZSX9_XANVA|nr:hypothetical protein C7V42_14355 [Xanthomonas vasicola pv. vasculorum]AZR22432.1 hypothetical protein NX81_008950 [Xanthomonas vasicola]KFA25076.1 hypothetical protein KW5_0117125 [Xanthomonas vasicola pv. vasculorum NCPPB 1326]KFA28207.1 hypothetical protein KWG_0118875 [Xanthomonas vasicola pv. vasculorum NCPPB 1381]AZM71813.1 hypothetical protein CXP37_14365 [Xanthomonas vasicola pv. vasculorum]
MVAGYGGAWATGAAPRRQAQAEKVRVGGQHFVLPLHGCRCSEFAVRCSLRAGLANMYRRPQRPGHQPKARPANAQRCRIDAA